MVLTETFQMYGAQSSAKPVLDMGGESRERHGSSLVVDRAFLVLDNAAENSFCRFFENMPPVCRGNRHHPVQNAHLVL